MKNRRANSNRIKITILLLICSALILNCSGTSAEDQTLNETQKTPTMILEHLYNEAPLEINLETVSFRLPEGFEDKSWYSRFIKPAYNEFSRKRMVGSETEKVFATHLPRGMKTGDSRDAVKITNIDSARTGLYKEVEGLKEEAKKLYGIASLGIKIEVFMDKEFDSKGKYPSLMIGRVMGESGKKMEYTREAFVFDTPSTFFHLRYITIENGEKIQKRFERMVESLELNSSEFTGNTKPSGDGYLRRFSGTVTLEVPSDLIPDRKFVYEKHRAGEKPDKDTAIELTLIEPDDQAMLSTMKDTDTIDANYGGSIKDETQKHIESKYYQGVLNEYTIIFFEGFKTSELRIARKWLRLKDKNGNVIILRGKAPAEKEGELKNEFSKWMQTFVPASERSSER